MVCKVVDLSPGDVLYMPKGVIHFAEAICNTTSAHVTYGLVGQQSYFDFAMDTCRLTLPDSDCQLLAEAWQSIRFQAEVLPFYRQFPIWLFANKLRDVSVNSSALSIYVPDSATLSVLKQALLPKRYSDKSARGRIIGMLVSIASGAISADNSKLGERTRRRTTDGPSPWWPPECSEHENTCVCDNW